MEKSFFLVTKLVKLWKKHKEQLETKTNICKICFNEIEYSSFHGVVSKKLCLCEDCFTKFNIIFHTFSVDNVTVLTLYEYNEMFQKCLYQFKGCYDYELKDIFLDYYKDYLKIKYANYIIIPVPSFKKHDEERGFNHIEEIFKCLNKKMFHLIEKTEDIKQADSSFENRKKIKKILTIHDGEKIKNKKVLLVDDVFTSGSTIKAMIKLVKTYNPKNIKVLVLSKTKLK